ncbi:hypothetical protein [Holzapfeliella sp. JNUCC 72]
MIATILKYQSLKRLIFGFMISLLVELGWYSFTNSSSVDLSISFIILAGLMGLELESIITQLNKKSYIKSLSITTIISGGLLTLLSFILKTSVTNNVTLFGFYHLSVFSTSYWGLFLLSLSAFNFISLIWLLIQRRSFTLVIVPFLFVISELLVPYLFLVHLTGSMQLIVFGVYQLAVISIELLELNYYLKTTLFDSQMDSKSLERRYPV